MRLHEADQSVWHMHVQASRSQKPGAWLTRPSHTRRLEKGQSGAPGSVGTLHQARPRARPAQHPRPVVSRSGKLL